MQGGVGRIAEFETTPDPVPVGSAPETRHTEPPVLDGIGAMEPNHRRRGPVDQARLLFGGDIIPFTITPARAVDAPALRTSTVGARSPVRGRRAVGCSTTGVCLHGGHDRVQMRGLGLERDMTRKGLQDGNPVEPTSMSGVLGAGHNGDATGRSLAREVNGRTRRLMYQLLRPRQERGRRILPRCLMR
jgi:hypothetical protein